MQAGTKPVGGKQTLRNSRARRSAQTSQHRQKTQPLLAQAERDPYETSDSASRPASPPRVGSLVPTDELTEHKDPYKKNERTFGAADWMKPPPTDKPGGKLTVDLSVHIDMLHSVSTVDNCAYIEFSVIFYWTDPRLIGCAAPDNLPPCLWGPDLELKGTLGEWNEASGGFCLRNSETGRLKRVRIFKGMVAKYWTNLKEDFPFDLDTIQVVAFTNSHYVLYDESKAGAVPRGRDYWLRPVSASNSRAPDDPAEEHEGSWLNLWWSGEVAEWKIYGVSTELDEQNQQDDGSETTNLIINFHVARKFGYYIMKLLVPISWLVLLSTTTFALACDDIQDRSGLVSTYFLSLFAFMFVVDDSLPKVDFYTIIDKIITVAVSLVAGSGFASIWVAAALNPPWTGENTPLAEAINRGSAILLIGAFVLANLCLLLPAYIKRKWATDFIRSIESICESDEDLYNVVHSIFGVGSWHNDKPKCSSCCNRGLIEAGRKAANAVESRAAGRLSRTSASSGHKRWRGYWALPQSHEHENENFDGLKTRNTEGGARMYATLPTETIVDGRPRRSEDGVQDQRVDELIGSE